MKFARLAVVGLLLCACSESSDWTAFVYPNIDKIPDADKAQNFIIGSFKTFELCQSAAIERLRYISSSDGKQGDYQCGLKCSVRAEYGGILICKEKRK